MAKQGTGVNGVKKSELRDAGGSAQGYIIIRVLKYNCSELRPP
jgi:hypothetical protein